MPCVRYPLPLRTVEDLPERGAEIGHETVRFWWQRFGPMFAALSDFLGGELTPPMPEPKLIMPVVWGQVASGENPFLGCRIEGCRLFHVDREMEMLA
jgi:hypothetical protein